MSSVVNRILNEGPESFSTLAKRFRSSRRDGCMTPQCLWRWHKKGAKRPDGSIVRLEAIVVSGRYLSSFAAIERYIAAQNESIACPPLPAAERNSDRRSKASAAAAANLSAAGI